MEVRVENVWTYFNRGYVVPFNLIKACTFWLQTDRYQRFKNPNIVIPPKSIYQQSSKRFLTGILPVLSKKGFKFELIDGRVKPDFEVRPAPSFVQEDERYRFQLDVFDLMLRCTRGIIKLVVGGGKTFIAGGFVHMVTCDHLIMVFRRQIFKQFVKFFEERFDEPIGVLGAGLSRNLDARVLIASPQTLIRRLDMVDLSRYGSVLVDEAHHVGWGSSAFQILKSMDNAYFRFGLSGTPIRPNGDHLATVGVLGPVIFNLEYTRGVELGILPPVKVLLLHSEPPVGFLAAYMKADFQVIYERLIVKNSARNDLLCGVIYNLCSKGKYVLVLVQRKLHGRILERKLWRMGLKDVKFIFGNAKNRDVFEQRFREGVLKCLIATDSMFSEGVSIHIMDAIVCAGGYKSPIATIQRVGRVLREKPGKSTALVIDVFDNTHKVLIRQSRLRKKYYEKEGYNVVEVGSNQLASICKEF